VSTVSAGRVRWRRWRFVSFSLYLFATFGCCPWPCEMGETRRGDAAGGGKEAERPRAIDYIKQQCKHIL